MLGLGLSIPQVAARGSRSLVAAIRSLFSANEPGVWYDPSDLSTLFQDSAGTTPVTAVEQPVGLMLDKSKGLVLGPELVTNGDFSNGTTGWTKSGTGTIQVVNGRLRITGGDTSSFTDATQSFQTVAGKTYRLNISGYPGTAGRAYTITPVVAFFNEGYSCFFTAAATTTTILLRAATGSGGYTTGYAEFDNISVRELPGNHAYQTTATSRPVLSARVNQYLATETFATQNVTTLAAQYRLRFEGTGTITLSGTATGVYSAGSHLITCTAGTLTSTVSGSVTKADLRVANDGANLPPYQRVNTATDYDTAGFPHYLRFDGVDDWLATNTITPGTDKVQVFAGVRKLSDAAFGMIIEFSNSALSNNGFLSLNAGNLNAGAPAYAGTSKGTSFGFAQTDNIFPAPATNVLSTSGDISGDSFVLRVNSMWTASSTADQGAGNFLAYPLYIGRRGGTSYPFNGRLYSLIVRFGSNLPAATIEKTEKYINAKTRAY